MPVLVETIVNRLVRFTQPDPERYAILLKKLQLKVKNFLSTSPAEQIDNYCAAVLFDRAPLYEDTYAALDGE